MSFGIDDDVASPCIDVCELDERGICLGCYRSGDEIAAWSVLGSDVKRQILDNVSRRRREHRAGRSGE